MQSTSFTWKEQFLHGAREYLEHGMSAGEKMARSEVRQLEKARARETRDKRIIAEALEKLQDPWWREQAESSHRELGCRTYAYLDSNSACLAPQIGNSL